MNRRGTPAVDRPGESRGRFPANVVLSHMPECREIACAPDCPVRLLDEQSGDRPAAYPGRQDLADQYAETPIKSDGVTYAIADRAGRSWSDTGGASRFFYTAKADADDRDGSTHPTVKPVDLMKWLVTLVTPPGGVVLDPFLGSGTTCFAARALGLPSIGIEREADYCADAVRRLRQGVLF